MVEVEITGNQEAMEALGEKITSLSSGGIKTFRHGGLGGEAGIFGVLASVLTPLLPKVIDILIPLRSKDRDLKVSFNGVEFAVRDIKEASELMHLLSDRGIVPEKVDHAAKRD